LGSFSSRVRSSLVGVLVVRRCSVGEWKNIPGSTTDLGEGELDAPDLTLVAETVLANSLQLSVAGCTLDI
jgi:hypothetical protein